MCLELGWHPAGLGAVLVAFARRCTLNLGGILRAWRLYVRAFLLKSTVGMLLSLCFGLGVVTSNFTTSVGVVWKMLSPFVAFLSWISSSQDSALSWPCIYKVVQMLLTIAFCLLLAWVWVAGGNQPQNNLRHDLVGPYRYKRHESRKHVHASSGPLRLRVTGSRCAGIKPEPVARLDTATV